MIHVRGRRVLVKPDEIENKVVFRTDDGQAIEFELAQDRKLERASVMKGTIIEVGHLCWKDFVDDQPWCNPGDWVMYSPYAGQFITDPMTKEKYLVMNDEDIIGTLDRETVNG